MKLLHLDASALGAYSVSRGLSAAIVAEFNQKRADVDVTYRDLHAAPLSHWALPAGEEDPRIAENAAVLDEFLSSDVVVIGAPMYNFGIASSLKAWIDRVVVAGKTFHYTANGPEGLAGGKRVIVASSRGGIYSAGSPGAAFDFQESYLRAVFGFLGLKDIEIIHAEGVALGDEQKAQAIGHAMAEIVEMPVEAA